MLRRNEGTTVLTDHVEIQCNEGQSKKAKVWETWLMWSVRCHQIKGIFQVPKINCLRSTKGWRRQDPIRHESRQSENRLTNIKSTKKALTNTAREDPEERALMKKGFCCYTLEQQKTLPYEKYNLMQRPLKPDTTILLWGYLTSNSLCSLRIEWPLLLLFVAKIIISKQLYNPLYFSFQTLIFYLPENT